MRFFSKNLDRLYNTAPTSFKTLLLLQLQESNNIVACISDKEEREIIKEELDSFPGVRAVFFNGISTAHFIHGNKHHVILAGDPEETVNAAKVLSSLTFRIIRIGERLSIEPLFEYLTEIGYRHVGFVEEEGEFAKRGGIIDIFPKGEKEPYRIELFGNTVNSIRIFDVETQRSKRKVKEFILEGIVTNSTKNHVLVLQEVKGIPPFKIYPNPGYRGNISLLLEEIHRLKEEGFRVIFFTTDERKTENYRSLFNCEVIKGKIFEGFVFEDEKLAVFSEAELRSYVSRRKYKVPSFGEKIEDYTLLVPGDYVVHMDYGIGQFTGLEKIQFEGVEYECIRVKYKDGKVFVPIHNLHKVERFVRDTDTPPPLSSLSSSTWRKKRIKAEIGVLKFARDILKIHALRKRKRGFRFLPVPEIEFKIWAEFPYEETEDQKRVIDEVLEDLESDKIMDRLVAGEVGFGKTEVALRVAVRVALNSMQTILLVPTTILALQHFRTFSERLINYPITVKMLSRLTGEREKREILKMLEDGSVDIVIGTHILLTENVRFKSPGLLIIDEEHRFGVEAKEILRKRFPFIDTLRLTATPIPRTLNMSLGRVYDLSVIETPPPGRESVETVVANFDRDVIKEAIHQEIGRGGKVFFIHNRIKSIRKIEALLKELFPNLKIGVAHGRMPRSHLEDIYINFYKGEYDILLSTAIIEAGVDFPEANTIIVNNAHLFGLAELHQLRGRVGRGIKKGYAYFLVPEKISTVSKRKLKTLVKYSHLGSGFKIAIKDMELRGTGNILGKEQHGFVNIVGFDMFFKLLEEAINELEGRGGEKEPEIVVKQDAYIPRDYIEDDDVRLSFYKRIAEIRDKEELEELKRELRDRFGPIPSVVEQLFEITKVRMVLKTALVDRVVIEKDSIEVLREGKIKRFSRRIPVENIVLLL